MKKLIFLAIFCLWAIGSNAKVINGLASINDLEKAGFSSGKRSISGGTVIVDNEAGTFGLAYEDYWGSTPAYKIYEKVRVGDSGYFDLGRGCVGSTNPVFDSYESGPQSDGAVFSIKANKDGWMTVFTKINPGKQYVVCEEIGGGVGYTIGAVGTDYKIYYTMPTYNDGEKKGYINFSDPDIDKFLMKVSDSHKPQSPWIVAGLDSTPDEGSGFLTFYVSAGKTYYVSALGSKMACQGFIFCDEENKPGIALANMDTNTGAIEEVAFGDVDPLPNLPGTGDESEIVPPPANPHVLTLSSNTHKIDYVPTEGMKVKAQSITLTYSHTAGWFERYDLQPYEYAGEYWDLYSVGNNYPEFQGENPLIPTFGVYYEFEASSPGALYIPTVMWEGKPLFVVEEDGKNLVPSDVYVTNPATDTARTWQEYYHTDTASGATYRDGWSISYENHMNPNVIRFDMEAGKKYYVYAKHSLMRICGFIFKPNVHIVIPGSEDDNPGQGDITSDSYKITYIVDGDVFLEYTIEEGTSIIPEEEPVKEGHTFSGWDNVPETMPAHDVTVSGTFSINSYNAIFKIGDEVFKTVSVVYGQPVVAPEAPAKEGHTFAGWQNVPETMPAHDVEILGTYTVNSYKLVYKVDGADYKEYTVDYGTAITAEANPEKEGCTFSGWDNVPETMPAHDVTVSGIFTINSYNLNVYLNGELYSTEFIEYGTELIIADPEVPEGKKFDGWIDEIPETMPAKDVDIHGTYSDINSIVDIHIDDSQRVVICTLKGLILYNNVLWRDVQSKLGDGLYIINGTRYLIRR